MEHNDKQAALDYHAAQPAGKLCVCPTKPLRNAHDLSLAYSPGVAQPCLEIKADAQAAYRYTTKGNLVAVISNGTAVLGLGNIGAAASKPVMEGKSVLMKKLAGINSFDIEVDSSNIDEVVSTIRAISGTFGAINLEDIKSPECFEIERRLIETTDIPVMHDDQHGTAIVTAAALINALELSGKKISEVKLVVNGAGAAAVACTNLYIELGIRRENIVMCDSKGVVRKDDPSLSPVKAPFATDRNIHTLAQAMEGADVFLGVSKADVVTSDMVRSMAPNPVIFALANPNPEISYDNAMAARTDLIFATGRSDYPNQVNNVLGFPYIFRGALDTRARTINNAMKLAAAVAISSLAKEPVSQEIKELYAIGELSFSKQYILPFALDRRLFKRVSLAVARAAVESGVARNPISDWKRYEDELEIRGCCFSENA